ncbi:hypothetical protein BDV06DRAFT_208630 [Aspergillus oleicola]
MDRATHVIDPNGDVVIVLQNPNAPFAEISEGMTNSDFTFTLPGPKEPAAEETSLQWPAEEPTPEPAAEPPTEELTPEWPADPAPEGPAAEEPVDALPDGPIDEPAREPAEESAAERPTELRVAEQREENCVRIQVSAKHLTLASSVFKKILTGSWKESIAYLQQGAVEISADSWDTEALLIMLRIIHCQSHDIPRKLTLQMLAKVAVLADYYDCRKAVDFFASTWINALNKTIPTTYSRDLILWLWVAWYFRLSAEFKKATATAMSRSNDWIDNLGLPFPDNIIRSMNDRRQGEIAGLIFQLQDTRNQLQSGSKGCGFECSSIMYGALTKQMHLSALLPPGPADPFPGLRYSVLVQSVLSFKSPEWCSLESRRYRYPHNCTYSTFTALFGMLNDTIEGLDIDSAIHL